MEDNPMSTQETERRCKGFRRRVCEVALTADQQFLCSECEELVLQVQASLEGPPKLRDVDVPEQWWQK
jgi:hypothetical protein